MQYEVMALRMLSEDHFNDDGTAHVTYYLRVHDAFTGRVPPSILPLTDQLI